MSKNTKTWLFCLLISFLFLMIGTKSSFLYPFNEWMDANCFFTIGKGMLSGKVPYLDLFDQKGPLLFFYHMIAALFSYTSFLGVFIIEVISFSFFLYYFYQTCHLYVKRTICIGMLPIISFLTLALPAFSHGDSAEEFCLPFLMYSIFSLLRFLKSKAKYPSYSMLFINGIMAGLVFTIKYSMIGFWFGFMFSIFLLIIHKKEYKRAFLSCLIFLGGMFLPILPWLLYFLYHSALTEFIDGYFLFNIKYYAAHISPILKFFMIFTKPIRFFIKNLGIGLPIFFGFFYFIFTNKMMMKRKWIPCLCFFFLCMGVFGGGVSFRYYYLILIPFTVFGFIGMGLLLQKEKFPLLSKYKELMGLLLITFCFCFTFYGSPNTYLLEKGAVKEDFVQYKFAKIINKQKNPIILNYGFLDGGFYTASGLLPTTKYFQKNNISDRLFPEMMKEQNDMIRNKKVDFVITRENIYTHKKYFNPYLEQNYKKIRSVQKMYEEKPFRYTLWGKK